MQRSQEGYEIHGRAAGSVMTLVFEIEEQKFVALNGGPHFKFNEVISFVVNGETQAEVDYYWDKLSAGSAVRLAQGQVRRLVADCANCGNQYAERL